MNTFFTTNTTLSKDST